MKKYISILFSLLIGISAFGYDYEDYGIYYNILSEYQKTCELAKVEEIAISNEGTFAIPSSVTINEVEYSVIKIASSAFYGISTLKEIVIPSFINDIGQNAFTGCRNLTSVYIEDSEKAINWGGGVFRGAPINIAYIGRTVNAAKDKVSFGGTATSRLFPENKSLTQVTMSNQVTLLPEYAFYGCNISEIYLSDNITVIPNSAFEYCTLLEFVKLPANLITVEDFAFRGCNKLNNIDFPETLTKIGWDGFMSSAFSEVDLSNTSMTSIGSGAFRSSPSIIKVLLPKNLVSLQSGAFQSASFSEIFLPETVTQLDALSLSYNDKITKVYSSNPTPPNSTQNLFSEATYSNATLYVPIGCKDSYSRVGAWKYFSNIEEIDFAGIENVVIDENVSPKFFNVSGQPIDSPNGRPIKRTSNKSIYIVL